MPWHTRSVSNSGGGAPPGLDPFGQSVPLPPAPEDRKKIDEMAGAGQPPAPDIGFPQPTDPLKGRNIGEMRVIVRDIPNIAGLGNWNPATIRSALASHKIGMFDLSGQLVDDLIADDRIISTLSSRLAGLFSREMMYEPANDSRAAREVLDAWVASWDHISSHGSLQQIGAYQLLFGWWPAQLIWNVEKPIKVPRLDPWHARFTYYHWTLRKYIALTQDGSKVIYPGDGKWLLHAPKGEYRAWMWGAMRAIAKLFLLRDYALRDMSRFSEVHGMPIRKAIVPASSDPNERDLYAAQLDNLGQETTIMVTQGADQQGMNFDLELVEATATAWEIFPGLRDYCDMGITLAILMQNLTTEVTGGSFAATQSHMDIRQNGIEADNESWKLTLREQVARPFAYVNFGDADLAPSTCWDVTPKEDYEANGRRFYSFGQAVQILRQGGVAFKKGEEEKVRVFARKTFGITIPENLIEVTEPDSGAGAKAEPTTEKKDAPSKDE